jgi:uncharacterized phage infection (PIP) family protein YhgE
MNSVIFALVCTIVFSYGTYSYQANKYRAIISELNSQHQQEKAQLNQLAAEQINAAAQAYIAQQQQANSAAAELEQVKAKLTNTAKTLQQRNQANAKLKPSNPNAAICLSDTDISLYNDAITFDRLPMLPAAVPSQLTAPPTTSDLIANHIDNSLRCTAIEAQLNQLITVIEQKQNKETP